jgi:hypothetical protein
MNIYQDEAHMSALTCIAPQLVVDQDVMKTGCGSFLDSEWPEFFTAWDSSHMRRF